MKLCKGCNGPVCQLCGGCKQEGECICKVFANAQFTYFLELTEDELNVLHSTLKTVIVRDKYQSGLERSFMLILQGIEKRLNKLMENVE
jgi:hypothetical protein